ncbi:glycosyltransferase family 4 protein [Lutimonas vermicola]|uniref:Glycosyltransferase family 4 protein n=1 Tax=Lutimonas vermicola TaxID=414288 RepID=A0ABU9L5X3_9FLAO
MNIGIVLGQTFVGGMERQVGHLSKGFIDKGHNVFVYTISPNISFAGRSKVEISSKIIYPLWGIKYAYQFSEWILKIYCKKHKIDFLIAFQIGSIEICNRIKSELGYPFVIGNIRGIQYASNEKLKRRYQKGCNQTDALVCNSKAGLVLLQQHVIDSALIPAVMIPNIVSVPETSYKTKQDRFIVLFAASLKEVKDPLTFLKGVYLAIKQNPNIDAIIAGDGDMREELKAFVLEKGLQENILFLGSVKPEEVPYNKASLVVSTSLREASSNTILEALANGACVIGTDVGGTTELLKDKSFGSLIEIGDTDALAKCILFYSQLKSDKLESKANDARDFIISNFDREKIQNAYINLCKSFTHE